MKTEVYSWRVSADLKTRMEREARRRKISLSAALDLAAEDWLKNRSPEENDALNQLRLHQAAAKCLGVFDGGNPRRAETVRKQVRESLRRKYGR